MKNLSLCVMNAAALTLASCATAPAVKTSVENQNDIILQHMGQGKKVVGKDFAAKFSEDGFINGEFVAIGSVKGSYNTNEKSMLSLAAMEAKTTLLESAPSEFKRVIQSSLSYVNNDNGSLDAVGIYVTEAKALTGVKVNFTDTQCVVYALPMVDVSYEYIRECRAIARVPATNLASAFKYTMDRKYKMEDQLKLKEIMHKQLMGVMLEREELGEAPTPAAAVVPVSPSRNSRP